MLKYIVIEKVNLKQLINEVNKMIKEGWKPLGGIAVVDSNSIYYHLQAMIYDEEFSELKKYYKIRQK